MSLPALGKWIDGICGCCRLPARYILREITDAPTCADCKAHRSDEHKRDETHLRLWSAKAQEYHEKGRARAAELSAEVRRLTEENKTLRATIAADYLGDRSPSVVELLESVVVTTADVEREKAYTREAELMALLILDIEPQHRGKRGDASKCSCGKLTSQCPEWQALEPIRPQIRHVEKTQLARADADMPHSLPYRHPSVRSRSEWKGLPQHLARRFSDMSREEREHLQQV